LYRAAAGILALVAIVFFAAQLAQDPVRAIHKPEVRPAPIAFEKAGTSGAQGRDAVGPDGADMKIGGFEAPQRDGARAVRLLIDTRSREEKEFVLIARDVKSRYSDYDAVSVEFTDTEDVLFYNDDPLTRDLLAYYGGALIFNTYDGALYLGYIYGPPNLDGYYVKAAD
jgi:hypothetical protein